MSPADDAATTVYDDVVTNVADDIESVGCSCIDHGGGGGVEEETSDHHNCPHRRKPDPSSSFLSSYAVWEFETDKLRRVIYASLKGFSIGAGLKGGLSSSPS
ncbi:hypothetical protein Dimus_030127 [Dionaea muscipula]